MLERLLAAFEDTAHTSAPVDPAGFADPLAGQTQWTPAKEGGASFCTRRLTQGARGTLAFRATPGMKLFALAFLLAGIATTVAGIHGFAVRTEGDPLGKVAALAVGLIFVGAGGAMLYATTIPIIFDRPRALFYRGERTQRRPKGAVPFASIHALQLLAEYVSGKNSSFYSYELNLVLENGDRVNVVDHGDLDQLRADADALGRFLGKPVWDAAGGNP